MMLSHVLQELRNNIRERWWDFRLAHTATTLECMAKRLEWMGRVAEEVWMCMAQRHRQMRHRGRWSEDWEETSYGEPFISRDANLCVMAAVQNGGIALGHVGGEFQSNRVTVLTAVSPVAFHGEFLRIWGQFWAFQANLRFRWFRAIWGLDRRRFFLFSSREF